MNFPATLRQRLRKVKIKCVPWRRYRYEVRRLPISAQCLFSKNGLNWDILEIELKEEGWLTADEELLEVLSSYDGLMRPHLSELEVPEEGPWDDSWTEKDYAEFYKSYKEIR